MRVTTFSESTPIELATAIIRLKERAHGPLNGLILDLRNDPGGLLDAAIEVAGLFVDGGAVVTTRGRNSADDHTRQMGRGTRRAGRTHPRPATHTTGSFRP